MRAQYIDKKTVAKLRGCLGSEEWLPLRVSLETGLRIGDVVDLLVGQVGRRNGAAYIKTTAQKTRKTGTFPISETLYKLLTARARKRGLNRTDFIFGSYGKTGHLTRQAAWARMKRAAEKLGIDPEGISPHSLRKSFAVSLMREHGLAAVKEALQHSNEAVTRIYAYSDTIMRFDSDAPVLWRDIEYIVDYILERLHEKRT